MFITEIEKIYCYPDESQLFHRFIWCLLKTTQPQPRSHAQILLNSKGAGNFKMEQSKKLLLYQVINNNF